MFSNQSAKWADANIVALVEVDFLKMRVRVVLAREAIKKRMRELEQTPGQRADQQSSE
ncbi:MAG TPA: hypothetical protein VKW06_05055 [Candidatus Angelobacter sp.]|nr:hypothetical protein [Candidatus Angelobacter sp.]